MRRLIGIVLVAVACSSGGPSQDPAASRSTDAGTQVPSEMEPLKVEGEVIGPVLVRYVRPEYSESALRQGLQGLVVMNGIISVEGRVEKLEVVQSSNHSELDAAALRAGKQWRYKPATLHGQPVRVYLTMTSTFRQER